MDHAPLERNIRKESLYSAKIPRITIQDDKRWIIQSSLFQMKKKLFPTSCRFSSSKDKTQKLSLATFCDPYPTQKSFSADPVPPDFQIDGIKEKISDRLLDGPVKVRKKVILKSSGLDYPLWAHR